MSYPIESQSRYMLIHQLSRITAEKGSLLQDDRLDALAIATNYWVQQMAANADLNMNERKNDLIDQELEKFMSSALGRKTNNHTNSWF